MKGTGRDEFGGIIRNERNQLNRLGVRIILNRMVTPEFVLAQAPDAVIVATGSLPKRPAIPGGGGPRVFTVWQVLKREADLGGRVLFIDDDGGHQAASAIEYIAGLGKSVHVVTTAYYVGGDLGPTQDMTLFKQRLAKKGITSTPDFYVAEIRGTEVHGIDVYSNEPKVFSGFDAIVAAMGNSANDGLYFNLKGKVREVYRAGDCVAPRKADMAIHEGYSVGRQV